MDINEKIQKLVLQNNLGSEVIEIQKVLGGLSHNMFKVRTTKGIFAVKELNPLVMQRKEAYQNFIFSEKVARIAKQNGINAVCALQFNGDVLLKIEDSFFMVFDWVNGQTLKAEQVKIKHCEVIGQTLAKIHNINFSKLQDGQNMQAEIYNFEKYIPLAQTQNKPYAQNLQNSVKLLADLNKKSARAINNLNNALTISHTDLDCKNVMWQDFSPFIIDWEASGCINSTLELVQVAWYWAGGDIENLDIHKFETLIKSYIKEYNGKICTNQSDLVYANLSAKLAWLNYNLERSLNKTTFEDPELADGEVMKTLTEINYCTSKFDEVKKILKEVTNKN